VRLRTRADRIRAIARSLVSVMVKLRNAKDERGKPLHTTRDWVAWVLTSEPDQGAPPPCACTE